MGLLKPSIEKMKRRKDVKGLIQALHVENESVQKRAAEALGEIGESAAKSLIDYLLYSPPFESVARPPSDYSREVLKRIATPSVVELLIRALDDNSSRIRKNAIQYLGEIGDPKAVERLIDVLKEDKRQRYDDCQVPAATALVKIGDARAIEPFVEALVGHDSDLSKCVHRALVNFGKPAVRSLIQVLKDNKYEGRHGVVAETLGEIGDSRAVEPLIETLKEGNYLDFEGREAVEAIAKIGDIRAAEPLMQVLEHFLKQAKSYETDWVFAWKVASALKKIGDPGAVESAVQTLDDQYQKHVEEEEERRRKTPLDDLMDYSGGKISYPGWEKRENFCD